MIRYITHSGCIDRHVIVCLHHIFTSIHQICLSNMRRARKYTKRDSLLCSHRTSLAVRFISQCDVRGACVCVRWAHVKSTFPLIYKQYSILGFTIYICCSNVEINREIRRKTTTVRSGWGREWQTEKRLFAHGLFNCCIQAQNRWTHHTRYLPFEICFCSCCCYCRELPTAGLAQPTNLNNWRNKFYCNMCFDFISVSQCNTPTKLQFYPMRRRGTLSRCCTYQYYVYLAKLMQTSLSCNK